MVNRVPSTRRNPELDLPHLAVTHYEDGTSHQSQQQQQTQAELNNLAQPKELEA